MSLSLVPNHTILPNIISQCSVGVRTLRLAVAGDASLYSQGYSTATFVVAGAGIRNWLVLGRDRRDSGLSNHHNQKLVSRFAAADRAHTYILCGLRQTSTLFTENLINNANLSNYVTTPDCACRLRVPVGFVRGC